jgi:enterochelin esterase-like enzyme
MRKFIALIFLLISTHIFSQERNYRIDTIQVKSEILKENRSIIIYRPQNILRTDSVKFIYLIDGENSNYRFQRLKERFKDTISNLVGIGIINTDRRRDLLYVKGADKFLDFITSELIPVTEKDYKIKTRLLYGHSFGGGFTVYSMINKPNYFNYFIASSPTPIMDLIKKDSYLHIDSVCKSKIVFYLSFGSKDMGQVKKWSQRLKDNLTGQRFNNFDWRFKIFEGKDHNNSDIAALLNGLNDLK